MVLLFVMATSHESSYLTGVLKLVTLPVGDNIPGYEKNCGDNQ